GDIVVDATASEAVAQRHAEWLARGVHVVTANKLGQGAALARAEQIHAARHAAGAHYGDSATVGAGLPLLSSLRALAAGGDHIHAVEGVLSGSMAWLLHRYDGSRAFSDCVREAAAAGYTEPDPREDLSGEDVRRKLLILARAAGLSLRAEQVQVDSLLPPALAAAAPQEVDAALSALDAPLAARLAQTRANGACLRFVGRFDAHGASVGLRELPLAHPLASGAGTDNRVAIHSDRYLQQPLLIQGPGAGAEVTAAALLDDVLRIAVR
ncbi:homoserine dehydrogenase, partial [Xanthomonas translucens]